MFSLVPTFQFVQFLFEKKYALIYQVRVSRFFLQLETIRIILRLVFTLTMHQRHHYRPVLPLHRNHTIFRANQWEDFYTMIKLLISDTTFPIFYFDFIEAILHPFPQVSNLARLISQKHNTEDTK